MLRLISFLLSIPEDKVSKLLFRGMLIDALTIRLGFVIILSSFADGNNNQDAVTIGATLLIAGILIRLWRHDANKTDSK